MDFSDSERVAVFARMIAGGETQANAYVAAGFPGHTSNASKLVKLDNVVELIQASNPDWAPRAPRKASHKVTGKPGFIYAMTHPHMPENVFKIGHTTRPVDVRRAEFFTTCMPCPFDLYRSVEVKRSSAVEAIIHKQLAEFQMYPDREFFLLSNEQVDAVMDDVADGIYFNANVEVGAFMEELSDIVQSSLVTVNSKKRIVTISLGVHPTTGDDFLIQVPYGEKKGMMAMAKQGIKFFETVNKHAVYAH